ARPRHILPQRPARGRSARPSYGRARHTTGHKASPAPRLRPPAHRRGSPLPFPLPPAGEGMGGGSRSAGTSADPALRADRPPENRRARPVVPWLRAGAAPRGSPVSETPDRLAGRTAGPTRTVPTARVA